MGFSISMEYLRKLFFSLRIRRQRPRKRNISAGTLGSFIKLPHFLPLAFVHCQPSSNLRGFSHLKVLRDLHGSGFEIKQKDRSVVRL